MKKFIQTILLSLLALVLVSCTESTVSKTEVPTPTDYQTIINEVVNSVDEKTLLGANEDSNIVTEDLDFITSKNGVSIIYNSTNEDIISNEGIVTRIFNEDVIVNITLTFKISDLEEEKVLTFKVIQRENYGILEDGIYISKDEVAIYIYLYNKLPSNYVKKDDIDGPIRKYWTKFNLLSIGGDVFYNREGLLPSAEGRTFIEVDIDYNGSSRNSKRIVYSNDGLIFYTDDHYASFVQFDTENFTWKSF